MAVLLFLGGAVYLFVEFEETEDNSEVASVIKEEKEETKEEEELEESVVEENNEEERMIEKPSSSTPKQVLGQKVECLYSLSGIPSPKGLAFSPDGKEFWVTSLMNKSRGIVVFDRKTGEHVKNITLPDGGGVEVIFNKNGSSAFVSQMETGRIFQIDAKKKEIKKTMNTGSTWTKVLALSQERGFIYASNWSGNNISAISIESGKLIETIPSVRTPRGIYVTEDGKKLYVAGFAEGEIQRINLETKESKVIYRTGGAMRHIVGDEERGVLYISDMGNSAIYKVDIKTDKVEKFADTERNPNTIALTPDKEILVVSNRGVNHPSGNYHIPGPEWGTILFYNTSNGKMVDAILGGNQPTALDVTNDGKYLAFSNFLDGTIEVCGMPSTEALKEGDGGASLHYKDMIKK